MLNECIDTKRRDAFGGKFRTTLKVPYAKKDSVVVEDWRSVRLDIQVRFCWFFPRLC